MMAQRGRFGSLVHAVCGKDWLSFILMTKEERASKGINGQRRPSYFHGFWSQRSGSQHPPVGRDG